MRVKPNVTVKYPQDNPFLEISWSYKCVESDVKYKICFAVADEQFTCNTTNATTVALPKVDQEYFYQVRAEGWLNGNLVISNYTNGSIVPRSTMTVTDEDRGTDSSVVIYVSGALLVALFCAVIIGVITVSMGIYFYWKRRKDPISPQQQVL